MFSLKQNTVKKEPSRVTNPFWAYNPGIKSYGDSYFNFGSHVIPRKKSEIKIRIPNDASEKEIREILKNSSRSGRSFSGYEKKTAEAITKAKNRKNAVSDLNILLNSGDKSLSARDIYNFLIELTGSEN